MTFNSYTAIKEKISQICNQIYDKWYTNSIQTANTY